MKEYRFTGKFVLYVSAKNKRDALDKAYEELERATSGTDVIADEFDEIELCEEDV